VAKVVSPKLLRALYLLVEITGPAISAVMLIYLLTGYQMLAPSLGLIPRTLLVHTDPVLRALAVALALIHSYAGLLLICERRIRSGALRKLAELVVTVLLAFFIALFTALEAMI